MSTQNQKQQAAAQQFQPGKPVPVGYVIRGSGGYHVCINPHVTGQTQPPANQSNDNWRWVSA